MHFLDFLLSNLGFDFVYLKLNPTLYLELDLTLCISFQINKKKISSSII